MSMSRTTVHDPFESFAQTRSGLFIPANAHVRRPVAIDLFAGAGGFSCGFHEAGWHVAAAVEYDTAATCTYLVNLGSPDTTVWTGPGIDDTLTTGDVHPQPEAWRPERAGDLLRGNTDPGGGYISNHPDQLPCEHFFKGDVRALTGGMILDALGLDQGDVDAVIGGPPCQGFSRSGKRDVMDPRNSLVFDFARIVCEIQPKTFVMENVTGIQTMLTPEGVPVLDALALVYENGGFGVYDALRRSLYGSAGAIAAIKGKPAAAAKKAAQKAHAARPIEQEALFA